MNTDRAPGPIDAPPPAPDTACAGQAPAPVAVAAPVADKDLIHLRLLATTDLHVHILPHDYYTGKAANGLGLARTATLIVEARAEAENCLLFDNGDFLQGSPLGDFVAQLVAQDGPAPPRNVHPMIAAMNHLRYDAATLGNHEFSHGLPFLEAALQGATFPVVSANVMRGTDPQSDATFVPGYVLLKRVLTGPQGTAHPITIGVIGFTPPQIMIWDHQHLAGKILTKDILLAAKTLIPLMRHAGAQLIVALSHSGIGADQPAEGMEDASTALAALDGIDALITGHSHLVFPSADFTSTDRVDAGSGTLYGKPAVMPGFHGSHLGVIDLYLARSGTGYQVRAHRAGVRPISVRGAKGGTRALVASHPGVVRSVARAHRDTLAWASRPVGRSDVALHSYFALIAPSPAMALVARAQALHVAAMLADTAFADLPVLGSAAPFKAGGRGGPDNYTDVPAGEVLLRHAADLYIHPNTSAAIRLTGAEITGWLDHAAGLYAQIRPGSHGCTLIDPEFPGFNFDVISGIGFQIDLSQPPRFDLRGGEVNPHTRRIRDLIYNGAPIDPSASFAIATNSYRVAAYARFLPDSENRILYHSALTNREVLLRHLATHIPVAEPAPNPGTNSGTAGWRFCPMPDTMVTFDTSPAARAHLGDPGLPQITPTGLTQAGFLRFLLQL